jgi:hypothetical protein
MEAAAGEFGGPEYYKVRFLHTFKKFSVSLMPTFL